MRRLLLILFPLLFATPAYSQSSNPTPDPTCGLPKEGTIVATVTYTLTANCSQTKWLEIKTSETSNITLTINGMGHTISNTSYVDYWGTTYLYNFLVVDDNGERTVQNVDNGRSPNVKVIIKNVTFDGNDLPFHRPWRLQSDGKDRISGTGAGILVDGDLTMENVTFTRGNGIWVRAKGTATLTNVLFEDSLVRNFGFSPTVKGMLHVAKSASVTLNNAVFRHLERVVIAIEKGGSLSTTGCLSFIRVLTHKAHHSGVYSGLGTWSNSSSGACSGAIGNGGQAVVSYSPELMPCGLPASGTIEGTVVYTLNQDCVCMNTVNIAAGARVTINGNDKRIEGCSGSDAHFLIGNARLTINNANIYGVRVRNYGGYFTLKDSTVTQALKTPIINRGWAYLYDSVFENNTGYNDGEGKVYYAKATFQLGRATFRDNIFRNNMPDAIEAYTTGSGSAIYLCGDNRREGNLFLDDDGVQAPLFAAEDGGAILGCNDSDKTSGHTYGSKPTPTPSTARGPLKRVCLPQRSNLPVSLNLGAIGTILFVQKCPIVIEIWEIMPNSQGQFALTVSQPEIEAASAGLVACSANGRAAVRIGLTEPVRQMMAYSKAYKPPSQRGGRDILISMGPTFEDKVHHIVIDSKLDGRVLGGVDTRPDGPPCQGASVPSQIATPAAPAPPPQPTPIPIAAPVTAQPAREDGSIVHVVQPGDTLWAIGVAYDVHPYKIIALNNLDDPSRMVVGFIHPGQELLIRPAP